MQAGFDYFLRFFPLGCLGFLPLQIANVAALYAPAESAAHGAVVQCGCHLDALVASYAVEPLFVAVAVVH